MSIIPYVNTTEYTGDSFLAETFVQGQSTRNVLAALGDYWTEYFTDQDLLKAAVSGAVTLYSTEYFRVLNTVLSSNVSMIPVNEPIRYDIRFFSFAEMQTHLDDANEIASYSFPIEDATHIDYLVSSLFDPAVVLEEDTHYVLEEGRIYFIVDLFGDDVINRGAYEVESGVERYILFWSINTLLDSATIYERFGTYLYDYDINSTEYKALVMALQFFYTQAKTIENIKTIINVLYGIPYSRYDQEVVLEINDIFVGGELQGVDIVTNQAVYRIPPFCNLLVTVDDVIKKFTLLAYWHEVEDYKTSPDWYEGARLPTIITNVTHPEFDVDSRAHKDGDNWEKYLYDLYDTTLKHNLVLLRTNLNFNNYGFFRGGASNLYKIIRGGFPVYLFPVIEAIFHVDEQEVLPNSAYETTRCVATLKIADTTLVQATSALDFDVLMPPLIEPILPVIEEEVGLVTTRAASDTEMVITEEELSVEVTIRPLDLPTICTMSMLTRDLVSHPIKMTNFAAKRLYVVNDLSDTILAKGMTAQILYIQSAFSRNITT